MLPEQKLVFTESSLIRRKHWLVFYDPPKSFQGSRWNLVFYLESLMKVWTVSTSTCLQKPQVLSFSADRDRKW